MRYVIKESHVHVIFYVPPNRKFYLAVVIKGDAQYLPGEKSICEINWKGKWEFKAWANLWAMVFPVSHVWMWEFDHIEGWALKNSCFK